MIKFSVIIPVYNVELYINKCIDSILGQTYSNFELILIDDGSLDNCPAICDKYASQDNRVIVIHKENGGLSSARNVGIKHAKGDYIIFLDSDDYWNSNLALDIVYRELRHEVDILFFGRKEYNVLTGRFIDTYNFYDCKLIETSTRDVIFKYLLKNKLFPGSAWVTVTRRALIIEENIYFTEGIKAEDFDWLINLFLKSKTFKALNQTFYVYLINRQGSITATTDTKSIDDMLFTIDKWLPRLNQAKDIDRSMLSHLAYLFSIILYNVSKISVNEYIRYQDDLKKLLPILKFSLIPKIRVIHLLSYCIPLRLLIKSIKIIYEFKKN